MVTDPTGFHDDIPEAEYHAHPTSLSVSGAKVLLKAPALFDWQRTHKVHKRAWDLGHGAHAKVLGVGAEIVVVQRTLTNRKGEVLDVIDAADYKSTSAQEHRDAIRTEGKTPLLRSELEQVDAMADKLSEHRMAMRLLSEGKPEVSAFCVDERTGVLRRGRFDWLGPTILDDYKSAVSSEPNAFVKAAANLGYHMQAAWYTDLAADLGHPAEAFAFIVQEKEPPYIVTVIELPADLVDVGRTRNRQALERFRDCTESGLWPGYVPDDEFAAPSAPSWLLREDYAA